MNYPKGSNFGIYSLFKEKQRDKEVYVIRRWVTLPTGKRKIERLPTEKYIHFREKPEELEAYVIRLNAELVKERRIRDGVEIKHAYISTELLEKYQRRRHLEVPSVDRIKTEVFYIRKHLLGFFINRMGLQKPTEWHRVHKDEWANYLLTDASVPKAPATLREVIQSANRFVAFLHDERPSEVPDLKFAPISKDRFKDLIGRREIDPNLKRRTFIKQPT